MRVLPTVRKSWLLLLLVCWVVSSLANAQDVFTLPSAKVGVHYEYTIASEGGLPPLQWSVVSGELPKGVNLEPTGMLRGVPASAREQDYEFSVEVRDSENPAQRYIQWFRVVVAPAELRIVTKVPALTIVKPELRANLGDAGSAMPSKVELKPASFTVAREPHWIIPMQAETAQAAAVPPAGPPQTKQHTLRAPLDPATFIQIVEDTKTGDHLTRYKRDGALQFGVDLESSLRIIPDKDSLGPEPALNKLYVSAKLTSGDSSKDVVVTGYSEVGKDKSTMASQSGAAFQSAANVQAMVFNMAYTVGDIVRYVYLAQPDAGATVSGSKDGSEDSKMTLADWLKTQREVDFQSDRARQIDKAIATQVQSSTPFAKGDSQDNPLPRISERFRLYQPEIKAISDFFLQPDNLAIVESVGVEVFWIDRSSLQAIAQQYKDDIHVALDSTSTATAQAQALQDLLERTKLVYKDFGDFRKTVEGEMEQNFADETHTNEQWNAIFEKKLLELSNRRRVEAFRQLKNRLATGSISLADYQAKDGDRLTVTVESLPADGTSGGIPAVFYISIKKYGAKIQWSPSLLFVRRLGVTDAEAAPATTSTDAPVNRINFAPSPGMTFGVAYFKRGESGGAKFLRALGPGVGMNVTFMNFNDPSFDLATQKFVNTTGTNVQIGAGVIGSLFDNKLQLSYGWNLNVERRRTYFGVGFGFIEIGKELTKYIGK